MPEPSQAVARHTVVIDDQETAWLFGGSLVDAPTVAGVNYITAVLLGWAWLDQSLAAPQVFGAAVVLASVWFGQAAARRPKPDTHANTHTNNRELANSV